MILTSVLQAMGLFAATNIDDIIVLSLFFARGAGRSGTTTRILAGQYLGFTAILAVSVGGALLGATLLPPAALPYFGLLPIVLGLRAAWLAWRDRRTQPAPTDDPATLLTPGTWQVAVITFANGGDNIGVYVPIFAVSTIATIGVYIIVFLIGVAIWCAAGRYFASHPIIAKALSRWGHIVLPVALITIGALILIKGGAFAL